MFDVKIVTYKGIYKKLRASSLNIPTMDGRRVVLSNHMPIVIPIEVGSIYITEKDQREEYIVDEGILQFDCNEAIILCNTIENINEISESSVNKILENTEKKLSQSQNVSKEDDLQRARLALQRALNKQKDARKG